MDTGSEVTREAVDWCYKLFLGRKPASEEIANSHLNRPSIENLRAFFASHPEFQAYLKKLPAKSAPPAALAAVEPAPVAAPPASAAATPAATAKPPSPGPAATPPPAPRQKGWLKRGKRR